MKIKQIIILILILSFTIFLACKKVEKVTTTDNTNITNNPFNTNSSSDTNTTSVKIDAATILGLHTFIFSLRCAGPACHDDSFEPDFRTVQSSYSTLVYHNVWKNTIDKEFTFKVIPGDTGASWLHERLTTDDPVLGKMPLYDNPLTSNELKNIEDWILNGAKNILGNNPLQPNTQ
jgi:hypothetical protein